MAKDLAPAKEKRDWVPIAAVGGGAAAVGLGLYFFMKKPPGVSPGNTFTAQFTFYYSGEGGSYILQVYLGHLYTLGVFDHVEGLDWHPQVDLPEPGTYKFDVDCDLPVGTEPDTYDAEAGIREPGSGWLDFEIVVYKKGAVRVVE